MHKKAAFIFPGQGAQYVGMAKDFYVQFSTAKQVFEEANDLLKMQLGKLMFEGPEQELTLTKNSQIAIYVASIAILKVLHGELPQLSPDVCAGLSLGEYTALTAAGVISFAEGVQLVRTRGELMHLASQRNPGTMAAILGMEEEEIRRNLSSAGLSNAVWIANLNCPGQIVISGTKAGITKAMDLLKEKGAKRALALDVSGAFHSGLMQEAEEGLGYAIGQAKFCESPIDVIMNVTGTSADHPEEMQRNLLQQLTSPVRWEQSIRAMIDLGVESFYEIGPGKTLQGMNRKMGVGSNTLSIEKTQDLEKLMVGK